MVSRMLRFSKLSIELVEEFTLQNSVSKVSNSYLRIFAYEYLKSTFLAGPHVVDLGAEWVYGANNTAYTIAEPLGVLGAPSRKWLNKYENKFYNSLGNQLPNDVVQNLVNYFITNLTETTIPDEYVNGTLGEYCTKK